MSRTPIALSVVGFAFAFGAAIQGLPWALTCGDGRVDSMLDALDDPSPWSICCSDRNRAIASLRSVGGCSGPALAIEYDLRGPYPGGAEWLIALRQFTPTLDLTPFTHLRFAVTGSNVHAHHNLQIKLVDTANRVDWFVGESLTDLPVWRVVYVDLRSLRCADGTACLGRSPLDLSQIKRIEIGVGRCLREVNGVVAECEPGSQDTNVVSIDDLAAVDLRPGAPHRLTPGPPERVTPNATVRATAAKALRDRQERNGLAPAWYEETVANYNTYAQAVRILVLVREYQATGDESYRMAAGRAIKSMIALQRAAGTPNAGAWFTAYASAGSSIAPRDGCTGSESATSDVDRCFWVGNTAWMLIALDRARVGLPDDRDLVNGAIDRAAAWVLGKVGRLPDYPDVITYGLEGNISAYFGLLAARRAAEARSLGEAIFKHGWDPVEQRMKIGVLPSDLGTAMDTAGAWGVHLLRSLGKEAEARASQSYIASMFRTKSFAGSLEGYGDVEGPWSPTVEFGAQGVEAGIPGAQHALDQIHTLQASDGTFPGSVDEFLGGGAWITRWHGIAPTAWVYFAHAGSALPLLYPTSSLPVLSLTPGALSFGVVVNTTGTLQSVTSSQTLTLIQSGAGPVSWTVDASHSWITVSPVAGSGPPRFTISINNTGGVLPVPASLTGVVTIRTNGALNPTLTAAVTLAVHRPGQTGAPVGSFDTPTDGASGVAGSIAVTGWAIDDIEVRQVRILRDPVAGEGSSQVFIGNGTFVEGARPDVATINPNAPRNTRAGWGYLMLTNFLPNHGNGTFKLYAYADDAEGHTTLLGTKTITCSNSTAVRPFGAIDTPGQGETVGGVVNNFGWVLVRGPARADPPFGTVRVLVDGAFLPAAPTGWVSRPDLTALFPATTYPGIPHALGVAPLDTTTLASGVHTIAWVVTADNGEADGIGSRYFTVANGTAAVVADTLSVGLERAADHAPVRASALSIRDEVRAALLDRRPLTGRRGYDLEAPWRPFRTDARGGATVPGEELDRFEIRLRGDRPAEPPETYTGYLRVDLELEPLPIGSQLDASTGVFTWQPGPGFIGTYDLVFVRWAAGRAVSRQDVRFVLHPKGSHAGPEVVIDTPSARAVVDSSFVVGGWAIDRAADGGTGVAALHVWAYPVDATTGVRSDQAVFVGLATHGGKRPDVAAIYGDRFLRSGYGIIVDSLPSGTYDLAVFAWSTVQNGFVPASVVRVTVR